MREIALHISGLTKFFNRRKIFSDITVNLRNGNSLAVTGRNGSGKSTLLKILSGVLSPSKGEVTLCIDDRIVLPADRFQHIGLVSPYLQLYDEFTGWENLEIARTIRGIHVPDKELVQLLELINLKDRRHDLVRTYSSGMKQRLKYAFALVHHPYVLFLDEPRSNLDSEGITTINHIMEEQGKNGILIVGTNDAEDVQYCEQV